MFPAGILSLQLPPHFNFHTSTVVESSPSCLTHHLTHNTVHSVHQWQLQATCITIACKIRYAGAKLHKQVYSLAWPSPFLRRLVGRGERGGPAPLIVAGRGWAMHARPLQQCDIEGPPSSAGIPEDLAPVSH